MAQHFPLGSVDEQSIRFGCRVELFLDIALFECAGGDPAPERPCRVVECVVPSAWWARAPCPREFGSGSRLACVPSVPLLSVLEQPTWLLHSTLAAKRLTGQVTISEIVIDAG